MYRMVISKKERLAIAEERVKDVMIFFYKYGNNNFEEWSEKKVNSAAEKLVKLIDRILTEEII